MAALRGSVPLVKKKIVWPTICLNRRQILERVENAWPDKRLVAASLAGDADMHIMGFPDISPRELITTVASFGARIGTTTKPEACVDEFIDLMKHLACPEPGWEGASIQVEE